MTATRQASYFTPRRLGHVNLWVDDIPTFERSGDVCGLRVEFSEPELIRHLPTREPAIRRTTSA